MLWGPFFPMCILTGQRSRLDILKPLHNTILGDFWIA
jgi:hypothetical protein